MSNYFKHKMRGKSPGTIAAMVIFGIAAVAGLAILFGFVIMWLWNWLMPDLFDLPTISYWQGVGLFILAKIIFGMGSGGSGKSHSKHHKKHECEDSKKSDFSKWKYYDKFWEEEGDQAYENYVARMTGSPTQSNGDEVENINDKPES